LGDRVREVPPRVVKFSQRPISSRSNQNVSAPFLTLALPPTRTMRIRPVDLPAPPLPPDHAQPVDLPDRLSLANSICSSAPFQRDDVEKLPTTPAFLYYLPKVPITTIISYKN
jgi:hypothetical protein